MKLRKFLSLAIIAGLAACGQKSNTNTQEKLTNEKQENNPKTELVVNQPMEETELEKKMTHALISTEFGDIKIRLYDDTKIHKENFIKIAKGGILNGTTFHRIMDGFMIQGGDPYSKLNDPSKPAGMGGPGYELNNEISRKHIHKRGALAAARMGDQVNPTRKSSGSQFYIVNGYPVPAEQVDGIEGQLSTMIKGFKYTPEEKKMYTTLGGTPMLDMQYTVFGEVVSGMDVVDKIAKMPKDQRDKPNKDIKMTVKIL